MSNEKTLFVEALAIGTPEQRQAFLDRACGDNAALRAEVEALLAAHERAASFLESPPRELAPTIASTDPALDLAGATIGHYKLLERIGEGGMGVVYMAEQFRPVKRRVALKIIKPGLDTKQTLARFEAERQALAMMDHPSIAKVFDAGATDTGRSYFVMELVRGIPITEYCDQNKLTPRQRLELFVQVCQAVQHAHQKGIIHRDIKPNNVLVTLGDGDRPIPKIIDFGIAKATGEQRLTDHTLFTEFRQLIGTPLYMSPEQAERSHIADVDTRSDVYSLGVLLYELLTGTTPFDKQRLAKAAYDEVRRIIREEEPPRPSTRLSTLGETITSISAQRQSDPKKLSQTVRGELDWIVMKALEKERMRRYETANALARDVQRFLTDEPVEACPPSRMYRFRKLARRNKTAITTGGLIAAVLVLATGVSIWQAVRATEAWNAEAFQRQIAQRATDREAAQRRQAEAVALLLQSVIHKPDSPAEKNGAGDLQVMLLAQLDQAAASLDSESSGDPRVRVRLRNAMGEILLGFGEFGKAAKVLRVALNEQRTLGGSDDPLTLLVMGNLARTCSQSDDSLTDADLQESVGLYEQLWERQARMLGPGNPIVLSTQADLARAYRKAGRDADWIRELEQIRDQTVKRAGEGHSDSITAVRNLARAYRSAGRTDEAIKLFSQVADQYVRLHGANDRFTVANPLDDLAITYSFAGRTADAVKVFAPKRASMEQFAKQTTALLAARYDAGLLADRAETYARLGRFSDAADDYRNAIKIDPHNHYYWHDGLVPLLLEMGNVKAYRAWRTLELVQFQGATDRAEALRVASDALMLPLDAEDLRIATQLADRAVGGDRPTNGWPYRTKGIAEYRSGRYRGAIVWLIKGIRADNRHAGPTNSTPGFAQSSEWGPSVLVSGGLFLAMSYERLGERQRAREAFDRATHVMDCEFPKVGEADLDNPHGGTPDWLICHAARKEAEDLFRNTSKPKATSGQ